MGAEKKFANIKNPVRAQDVWAARFNKILSARFALLLVSLVLALYTYTIVSQLKSLPAPIFGGDHYYQQGSIEHIIAGGNPLESSSIPGGVPGYLPVFSVLVAAFSILFRLDAVSALMYFSVIVVFLMPVFWALAIRNFVRDEWWAVIGALAVMWIVSIENSQLALPIMKYTEFSFAVMLPLFLHYFYHAYADCTTKNTALLAFFYSLLTLSHMLVFIGASVMLVFVLLFAFTQASFEGGKISTLIRNHVKQGFIFSIVTVPIMLCYWHRPLFIHQLGVAYDRVHIDFPDYALRSVQLDFLSSRIGSLFLDFSSIGHALKSVIMILSLATLGIFFKLIFRDKKITFLAAVFMASLLVTFSYFLTEPLLNLNFIPPYMFWIAIPFPLIILGAHDLDRRISPDKIGKQKLAYALLVLVLLSLITAQSKIARETDNRFQASATSVPNCLISLGDFIRENTSVNDVFLSGKELGFMLNALTGRKLVTNRWLHQNDPYMDFPQRDLDAAIILYGDNLNARMDLIRKYHLKYLYWDINWMPMEYRNGQDGRQVIVDPLHTLDTAAAREALQGNGVRYQVAHTWLDPAVAYPDYRKYDVLLISQMNYRSIDMPWEPQLNRYLEEVWAYNEGGRKIAALYRIRGE